MYNVQLTEQAQKDLRRLDRTVLEKALRAMTDLATNPLSGHALTGSLRGVRSLEFSAPGGAYRAAYIVHRDVCIVFMVGPHENFYKIAERRYRALKF